MEKKNPISPFLSRSNHRESDTFSRVLRKNLGALEAGKNKADAEAAFCLAEIASALRAVACRSSSVERIDFDPKTDVDRMVDWFVKSRSLEEEQEGQGIGDEELLFTW